MENFDLTDTFIKKTKECVIKEKVFHKPQFAEKNNFFRI